MMVKTLGKGLRFVLVLAILLPTAMNLWSKTPGSRKGDAPEGVRLKISVYNDAEVPTDVLDRAATRVGLWRVRDSAGNRRQVSGGGGPLHAEGRPV